MELEAIYIWPRVPFNGSRTFKENPTTYKNKETQSNHHLIEIKAHHQKKKKKKTSRSTEEKPRAVAKAVVTKKATPITDSYFIYLIFHCHNTAYRKRLRGWRKEIEN